MYYILNSANFSIFKEQCVIYICMRETCTARNNNSLFDSLIFDISDCLKKRREGVRGMEIMWRGDREMSVTNTFDF